MSFDEDDDVHQNARKKNKRPLLGPATAKSRLSRQETDTTTSDSEEEQQPARKKRSDVKPPAAKQLYQGTQIWTTTSWA